MALRRLTVAAAILALSACSPPTGEAVTVSPTAANPEATVAAPTMETPAESPAIQLDPNDTPAPPPPSDAADSTQVVPLKYMMGDVTPATDPLFVALPGGLASKAGMYGHKDAVAALSKMAAAAARDGIELKAVSAFRSFKDQKRIWENKWTGATLVEHGKLPATVPDPKLRALKILEFSSMPGTSRHHWGTDFDLNDLSNSYFDSGKGKAIHDWLSAHGAAYGFCQVYSPKGADRPNGYNEERWHWSYVPVASVYLKQYPTVMGYEHLTGFLGSETAREIDVIPNYVQGINPDCKR
jgi:zinc D-Ala-D-Ala carboxypeptidase